MEYTKNYHLPQWKEDDRIMMRDFNQMCADMEKGLTEAKDAATLAQSMAEEKGFVVGSYSGNGNTQNITLGFRPSFLIITAQLPNSRDTAFIAISGGSEAASTLKFSDNGFTVIVPPSAANTSPLTNQSGRSYHYLAMK